MHFSCDSCKTTLQIADEKVRGKRLLVRCKRCGAKITISDPALGAMPLKSAPAPAQAAPARPAAVAAKPDPEERDTDTESTRAMDSDLLEKALQASKSDDASSMALARVEASALDPLVAAPAARAPAPRAVPPAPQAPPPLPAAEPPAVGPRDPAIWFAMLAGKQVGPLTRGELGLKTAQAALGPRTYLWKEGMGSWQRAKDVPELASLFAAPPEPPADGRGLKPPPPVPAGRDGIREFSTQDFGALDLAAEEARRTRERAESEFSTQDFGRIDLGAERALAKAAPRGAGKPSELKAAARPEQAPGAKVAPPAARTLAPEAVSGPLQAISLAADEDHDESTSVDSLPLGERVHQERVASELFSSGEHTGGQSAVDLARWASSELGKKGAVAGASSAEVLQAPKAVPFSPAPAAPGLVASPRPESTSSLLAGAGAQKSRLPLFMALVIGVIALVALALWAFSGDSETRAEADAGPAVEKQAAAAPPPAPVAAPDPGGSAGVAGLAAAAQPPVAAPAALARPARKGDKVSKAELSAEQAAAMKGLANERGVGSHGPAGESAEGPVSQGLTADQVRKKLDDNKGALQGCIDEALRRDPNLRVGKIHIATTIAPSGAVTSTKIDKRTVDETPLGSCLKRATKRIVFPSFGGDAFDVDIPIVVTAGE